MRQCKTNPVNNSKNIENPVFAVAPESVVVVILVVVEVVLVAEIGTIRFSIHWATSSLDNSRARPKIVFVNGRESCLTFCILLKFSFIRPLFLINH